MKRNSPHLKNYHKNLPIETTEESKPTETSQVLTIFNKTTYDRIFFWHLRYLGTKALPPHTHQCQKNTCTHQKHMHATTTTTTNTYTYGDYH